jgi:hypothetical protein
MDGFFTDNVFAAPRVDGDWNRDGIQDSQSNPTVQTWFRQGYRYYFDSLRNAMPGKLVSANAAFPPGTYQPEYENQFNSVVMEGMIGYDWSYETWGGFGAMMSLYRGTMSKLLDPKLAIFHQSGSPTDYRSFRYGFGSCLLDDGYYYFAGNGQYNQAGLIWFDEYNYNLGYATSSPPSASWQSGVYRRDFQNGIVLVNPKGNGSRQVFLETDYVKIKGSQDPSVNNGKTVRSVTLQDRDGIVLLRTSSSGSGGSGGGTSSSSSSSSSSKGRKP